MSEYAPGTKILIKTSFRKDGRYILAGRPATVVKRTSGWGDYDVEVQMPDGPFVTGVHLSTRPGEGFVLDNPENRKKHPVPDWNQIDLEELHWPSLMSPTGIRVNPGNFDGFMKRILDACGGVDATGTDVSVDINVAWGDVLRDKNMGVFIFPSKDRVDAVRDLLNWIRWYRAQGYETGIKKGHKLLVQLNDGELTMADFNESVRSETGHARVDHRNPWPEEEEEEEDEE